VSDARPSESALRSVLADYAQRIHARGWVANHDGNLSVRLEAGRYLATPTAVSKAEVRADGLVIVDDSGAKISGRGRPFSEISLHLEVYRHRPDVRAVVHAHPPTATGFSVAGVELNQPMIAEAVVSIGPGVPTVPFAAPGASAAAALKPFVADYDAVLLGGHGVLAWGDDVEQAYLRLELVEHLARIALVAHQLGGIRPLPTSVMPALLDARRKAGLGPAARSPAVATAAPEPLPAAKAPRTVVACAPAPPGSDVVVYQPERKSAPAGDLATIIRQEIVRALGDKK
jgi:L-fuculose-phosphate aldolase